MSRTRAFSAACLMLAALLAMSACTGPSTTVPTNVAPTAAPAAAPPETTPPLTALAPTTSPATATPAPAGNVLPAPLYVLDGGQIVRIERDGATRALITNEAPPAPDALAIVQFDASLADGTLVYIVQGVGAPSILVRTDANGGNRTVLLDTLPIAAPRLSPDGAMIALRVFEDYQSPGMLTPGLYLMPVAGGAPRLLLADEPVTDPTIERGDGRGFEAIAWSPDGTKLLVNAFSLSVEMCELAIVDVASGAIVYPAAPAPGLVAACAAAAWTPDSQAIYFNAADPGKWFTEPGIWRGDAASGAVTSAPVEPENMLLSYPLIVGNQLYALSSPTPDDNPFYSPAADPSEFPVLSYTPGSVPLTGGTFTPLRSDVYELRDALWAPDGSGVVILASSAPSTVRLIWLRSNSSPEIELHRGADLYAARWGKP